jgi:hypothetical protein
MSDIQPVTLPNPPQVICTLTWLSLLICKTNRYQYVDFLQHVTRLHHCSVVCKVGSSGWSACSCAVSSGVTWPSWIAIMQFGSPSNVAVGGVGVDCSHKGVLRCHSLSQPWRGVTVELLGVASRSALSKHALWRRQGLCRPDPGGPNGHGKAKKAGNSVGGGVNVCRLTTDSTAFRRWVKPGPIVLGPGPVLAEGARGVPVLSLLAVWVGSSRRGSVRVTAGFGILFGMAAWKVFLGPLGKAACRGGGCCVSDGG